MLDSAEWEYETGRMDIKFPDILFALDFPKLVDKPPVVPDPDRLPGAFVHIPDQTCVLRLQRNLGKSPNAPITAEEMERLEELNVPEQGYPRFNRSSVCNQSENGYISKGIMTFPTSHR